MQSYVFSPVDLPTLTVERIRARRARSVEGKEYMLRLESFYEKVCNARSYARRNDGAYPPLMSGAFNI